MELLPIDDPSAPKFWRFELSGRLDGAITRYLEAKLLTRDDIQLIRAYLQQWIDSPVWEMNPGIDDTGRAMIAELRESVRRIEGRVAIDTWLAAALDLGIDPL